MKCFGACVNQGVCNNRQGRVLSQAEWLDADIVPDREFCKWKQSGDCMFAARHTINKPMDAATQEMLRIGETIENTNRV